MHTLQRVPRIWIIVLFGVLSSFVACGPPTVPAGPDLVPAGTVTASARVGALPVSVSVSNGGAAIGMIPVWTPEGRGGIAPSLALSYSSAAGNGLLGVGWSLSGFSSIARCPPSGARFAPSDRHNNIRFDATDRYCLNGTLLVETRARSSDPSDALAAYHPENDPDVLVEAYGTSLADPLSFKAWSSGGAITTFQPTVYGRRVSTDRDSGILDFDARNSTLEWGASRVEDVSGNSMTIAWRTFRSFVGVEVVPDYITYTHGPLADAANRVELTYEARLDTDLFYVNGFRLSRAHRLAKILVYGLDENEAQKLVRDYRLVYRSDGSITRRSLLQSVTTCDVAGICLPATTFEYEAGSEAVTLDTTNITNSDVTVGDINGDGRDEAISRSNEFSPPNWLIWRGTEDGLRATAGSIIEDTAVSGPIFADFNGDLFADLFEGTFGTGWHYRPNHVGDLDPFFSNQVLSATETRRTGWGTACSNTSTCASNQTCMLVEGGGVCVDFAGCSCTSHDGCPGALIPADDGDDRACVPRCEYGSPCSTGMTCVSRDYRHVNVLTGEDVHFTGPVCVPDPSQMPGASPLYVVDTNSNGVLEAIVLMNNGAHRFERDTERGLNSIDNTPYLAASVASEEDGGSPHHVIDLNGDGLTDLVGGSGLTRSGSFERFQRVTIEGGGYSTLNEHPYGNQQFFVDVNGDGLPDIIDFNMPVRVYGYQVGVRLNTGRCVAKPPSATCVLGFETPYDAFGGSGVTVDTDQDTETHISDRSYRWWLTEPRIFPVDFDVNGHVDLIVLGDDPCLLRSDGRLFTREPLPFTIVDPAYTDPTRTVPGKFDRDDTIYRGAQHHPLTLNMMDVDGNGRTDYLYPTCDLTGGATECDGVYTLARTSGVRPDVLTTIVDGMGGKTTIDYRDLSTRTTLDKPLVHDCSSLVASDSARTVIDGSVVCGKRSGLVVDSVTRSAGTVNVKTEYGWGNRIIDPAWGSLGFDETRVRDASRGTTTTSTFRPHQVNTMLVDGALRGRTYWWLGTPSSVESQTTTSDGVRRATSTRVEASLYDPTPSDGRPLRLTKLRLDVVTAEEFTYASGADPIWGEAVTTTRRVVSYDYVAADSLCGTTGYGVSTGSQPWLRGTPVTIPTMVTTKTEEGHFIWTSDSTVSIGATAGTTPGQLLVQSICEVDKDPERALPLPIVRRSTLEYDTLGRLKRTTREPGAVTGALAYQYLRTDLLLETDGLISQIVQSTAGDCPETRTQTIGYDDGRQYPALFINDLEQVSYVGIHPSLGVVASTIDEGGVRTTMRYDGFGRPTAVFGLTGIYFAYTSEVVGGEVLLKQTATASTNASIQRLFSAFGQLRVERNLRSNGRWAQATTRYDASGRPETMERPHFAGPEEATETWRATYDELDRLRSFGPGGDTRQKLFFPDTSLNETGWVTDGGGRWSYTVDRDRRAQAVRRDGLGRVVEVHQGGLATAIYKYSPSGQLTTITDANGNESTLTYDALGFRTRSDDAGSGTTTWEYNAFGDVTVERRWGYVVPDAPLPGSPIQTRSFVYDSLGRKTAEYDGAVGCGIGGTLQASWSYDTATNGIGRLAAMATSDGPTNYSVVYNNKGQIRLMTQTVGVTPYSVEVEYDTHGRESRTKYPALDGIRYAVSREYSTVNGALKRIYDSTGKVLWTLNEEDGEGRTTAETLGNNIAINSNFWAFTGELKTQRARLTGATTNLFDFAYGYDREGNLGSRVDAPSGRTETMSYDGLERLRSWSVRPTSPGTGTLLRRDLYDYDAGGNMIASESQIGSDAPVTPEYEYAHPHFASAPTRIGTERYLYDDLGRRKGTPKTSIAFNRHDLPSTIIGSVRTEYLYDANGNRVRKTNAVDASEWTIYVGKAFELRAKGTAGVGVHYVPLPNGHLYQHEVELGTGSSTRKWMIGDGRGSLVGVTDESGVVVERLYLDPWGARVGEAGVPMIPARSESVNVGFTGHEHDEEYGLINMNGRVFDPLARQFLTQDPIVSVFNTQSASPYSYVKNRPYALVDPSGFQDTITINADDHLVIGRRPDTADNDDSFDDRWNPSDRLPMEPPSGDPIAGRFGLGATASIQGFTGAPGSFRQGAATVAFIAGFLRGFTGNYREINDVLAFLQLSPDYASFSDYRGFFDAGRAGGAIAGLILDFAVIMAVLTTDIVVNVSLAALAFFGAPESGGGSLALAAAASSAWAQVGAAVAASPLIAIHIAEGQRALAAVGGVARAADIIRSLRSSPVRDFASRNTVNRTARYASEGDARAFARRKVGPDPIEVEPGKLRSRDGRWQYRARPADLAGEHGPNGPHMHLERLNPETGEVLENWHLTW